MDQVTWCLLGHFNSSEGTVGFNWIKIKLEVIVLKVTDTACRVAKVKQQRIFQDCHIFLTFHSLNN